MTERYGLLIGGLDEQEREMREFNETLRGRMNTYKSLDAESQQRGTGLAPSFARQRAAQ
jgi:hypothetical protein